MPGCFSLRLQIGSVVSGETPLSNRSAYRRSHNTLRTACLKAYPDTNLILRDDMLDVRGFLARLHGLASLQKALQPSEDPLPALAVAGQVSRSTGKSLLTDFQKCACTGLPRTARMKAMHSVRLQFPAHHSLERAGPTGDPGMDQQTGWIHFQVLSLDRKGRAISVGADA